MKERFLDVIKWGLILVIAGVVFYKIFGLTYSNIYPKFALCANVSETPTPCKISVGRATGE